MKNDSFINRQEILDFNCYYHIYNRAVGSEKLFLSDKDYFYFLEKLKRYLIPILDIYAYCLIPNHFHLLVKTKDYLDIKNQTKEAEENSSKIILGKPFKNFFNSYSKSFNKAHQRMGRLFIQPYKRIKVENENYLKSLIVYVHRNPVHHGLVKNFHEWKYSSYNDFTENTETFVTRKEAISLFGSVDEFVQYHKVYKSREEDGDYIIE